MKHQTAMRSPITPDTGRFQVLQTPEAMERLGAALASLLRPGEAVCLWGPLGAGKTTLARALIRALTTPLEEAPSPTFTLVQVYQGESLRVAHFDLYRLKSPQEAFELGFDEALDDGAVIVEWPERLEGALPADRLDIEIAIPGSGAGRVVRLSGHGSWKDRALAV